MGHEDDMHSHHLEGAAPPSPVVGVWCQAEKSSLPYNCGFLRTPVQDLQGQLGEGNSQKWRTVSLLWGVWHLLKCCTISSTVGKMWLTFLSLRFVEKLCGCEERFMGVPLPTLIEMRRHNLVGLTSFVSCNSTGHNQYRLSNICLYVSDASSLSWTPLPRWHCYR